MAATSKTVCCADRSILALPFPYQEYLVTFKLMTSQVVQRARPLRACICAVGSQRVKGTLSWTWRAKVKTLKIDSHWWKPMKKILSSLLKWHFWSVMDAQGFDLKLRKSGRLFSNFVVVSWKVVSRKTNLQFVFYLTIHLISLSWSCNNILCTSEGTLSSLS